MDAWELEEFGFQRCKISTKLRIIKNLLEQQFDSNVKFKEKINEIPPTDLRWLPIGRDVCGRAYWYLIDKDLSVRIYREEQDDVENESWQIVVNSRNQLESLITTLQQQQVNGEAKEDVSRSATPSTLSSEDSNTNTLPEPPHAATTTDATTEQSATENSEKCCFKLRLLKSQSSGEPLNFQVITNTCSRKSEQPLETSRDSKQKADCVDADVKPCAKDDEDLIDFICSEKKIINISSSKTQIETEKPNVDESSQCSVKEELLDSGESKAANVKSDDKESLPLANECKSVSSKLHESQIKSEVSECVTGSSCSVAATSVILTGKSDRSEITRTVAGESERSTSDAFCGGTREKLNKKSKVKNLNEVVANVTNATDDRLGDLQDQGSNCVDTEHVGSEAVTDKLQSDEQSKHHSRSMAGNDEPSVNKDDGGSSKHNVKLENKVSEGLTAADISNGNVLPENAYSASSAAALLYTASEPVCTDKAARLSEDLISAVAPGNVADKDSTIVRTRDVTIKQSKARTAAAEDLISTACNECSENLETVSVITIPCEDKSSTADTLKLVTDVSCKGQDVSCRESSGEQVSDRYEQTSSTEFEVTGGDISSSDSQSLCKEDEKTKPPSDSVVEKVDAVSLDKYSDIKTSDGAAKDISSVDFNITGDTITKSHLLETCNDKTPESVRGKGKMSAESSSEKSRTSVKRKRDDAILSLVTSSSDDGESAHSESELSETASEPAANVGEEEEPPSKRKRDKALMTAAQRDRRSGRVRITVNRAAEAQKENTEEVNGLERTKEPDAVTQCRDPEGGLCEKQTGEMLEDGQVKQADKVITQDGVKQSTDVAFEVKVTENLNETKANGSCSNVEEGPVQSKKSDEKKNDDSVDDRSNNNASEVVENSKDECEEAEEVNEKVKGTVVENTESSSGTTEPDKDSLNEANTTRDEEENRKTNDDLTVCDATQKHDDRNKKKRRNEEEKVVEAVAAEEERDYEPNNKMVRSFGKDKPVSDNENNETADKLPDNEVKRPARTNHRRRGGSRGKGRPRTSRTENCENKNQLKAAESLSKNCDEIRRVNDDEKEKKDEDEKKKKKEDASEDDEFDVPLIKVQLHLKKEDAATPPQQQRKSRGGRRKKAVVTVVVASEDQPTEAPVLCGENGEPLVEVRRSSRANKGQRKFEFVVDEKPKRKRKSISEQIAEEEEFSRLSQESNDNKAKSVAGETENTVKAKKKRRGKEQKDSEFVPSSRRVKSGKGRRGRPPKKTSDTESTEEEDEEEEEEEEESLHFSAGESSTDDEKLEESDGSVYEPYGRNAKRAAALKAKMQAAHEIKTLLAKKALLAESAAQDARKLDMEIAELQNLN